MKAIPGAADRPGSTGWVLCGGTLLHATLDELAAAARSAGFEGVSLWPHHVAGRDPAEVREVLDDQRLALTELEPLLSWVPDPALPSGLDPSTVLGPEPAAFLALAQSLGATSVLAVDGFGSRAGLPVVAEHFGALCDAAAERGLSVKLEFTPWSCIPDAATAHRVLRLADRANAGLVVDAWHHHRGARDLAQIAALPGELVHGIQLCDAAPEPAADLPGEAMRARRLPGEGAVDLPGLLRALASTGCRAPIGVEIFSQELNALPPAEAAHRAADATRRLLAWQPAPRGRVS